MENSCSKLTSVSETKENSPSKVNSTSETKENSPSKVKSLSDAKENSPSKVKGSSEDSKGNNSSEAAAAAADVKAASGTVGKVAGVVSAASAAVGKVAPLVGTDGALQAELQVTMEMIQVAHHEGGGGDNLSLTVPRSMRLNVPKFSGLDPDSWIFAITGYFTLLNTPVDQQLRMVGFNLKVDAAEWFRWMSRNMLITTWGGFLESVQNRFWPCMYEDPQGALLKLLQKGTVAQYQSEFEKLMNHVTNVFEGLLISFYISGLKPPIQRELLVSKPASLGDAFSLARVTEARLKDQKVFVVNDGR
ncbi:ty3-gypsy retrotransposon protein [Tanacetum coccineum]